MFAPVVAEFSVTDIALVYVPAEGENVGVDSAGEIVYVAVAAALVV
jgi:hypothetical protein